MSPGNTLLSIRTYVDSFMSKVFVMPLYMDLHRGLKGLSREAAGALHQLDVEQQDRYGVKFHKFWVNEEEGTVFCLMEAPSKEACLACHFAAHGEGGTPCELIEVHPSDYATMLGPAPATAEGAVVHPDGQMDSAVRVFLFTDIVGSTSLTELLGDIGAMGVLKKHNEIVRNSLQDGGGKEIKHTGDGIMATFLSSSKAVRSALDMQQAVKEYRDQHAGVPLHIKIGLNAGEPVTEGDDFFGAAVQLTRRICDLAAPDQVLISETVKGLCMGRKFTFEELPPQPLKGFRQPVKTFAVLGY